MKNVKAEELVLSEYTYELPQGQIAEFPLAQRDQSRLLYYKQGRVYHKHFFQLPDLLPEHCSLFFNNTRVIPARILFFKETGARIELFLLQPIAPYKEISEAMAAKEMVVWECMIGNKKRWKKGQKLSLSLNDNNLILEATYSDEQQNHITLRWNDNSKRFVEIIQLAGLVPLPPYIKRAAVDNDKETYQTVYSKMDGAVAAPTAGLHFTPAVLNALEQKGINMDHLTLHVGAGTFQPLKTKKVTEHPMHREQIVVSKNNLNNLLASKGPIIPVGTTSMRTLESIYWYGVKLIQDFNEGFFIEKLCPYQDYDFELPDYRQAIEQVILKMEMLQTDELVGETEIFIFPGYQFRVCNGIVTNFHQPGSTLILLVAALLGKDWKKVYDEALSVNYRFLSYGDSSLLIP